MTDWANIGQRMENLAETLSDATVGPPAYTLIGSERYPVRVSSLTRLQDCVGRFALGWGEEYGMTLRTGGVAADTGTGVGLAIELFHRGTDMDAILPKVEAASKGLLQDKHAFPKADLGVVRRVLAHYVRDPRNPRDAVMTKSLEMEVKLTLPPHPIDPTGKPIHFVGHLDQIRDGRDGLKVWDLKHSNTYTGPELVRKYSFQQACYALAASNTLGKPVGWGGIISTRQYLSRNKLEPGTQPVFHSSGWTMNHCRAAMDVVRLSVAQIRAGQFPLTPGTFCSFCPGEDFKKCFQDF